MRKILLSILFAITVLGFNLPLISNPAHASCSDGTTYDGNGNATTNSGHRCDREGN